MNNLKNNFIKSKCLFPIYGGGSGNARVAFHCPAGHGLATSPPPDNAEPRDSWLGSADRHAPLTEHVGCMVVAVRQACLPMQAGAAATATRLAATFPDVPAANGYAPCLGAACIAQSVISAIFFFYY